MYEEFFKLQSLPFSLTPNPNFFCHLKSHQEALNTLQFCIYSGEEMIKIIGKEGAGKTLLCKKLLANLDSSYITIHVPNPALMPIELDKFFAQQLGLDPVRWPNRNELLSIIYQNLISLRAAGKKVVLLIDEAHTLNDDSFEIILSCTNFELEHSRLLQVVLFAKSVLNDRLNETHLANIKQKITFSCALPLMKKNDLDIYLKHRLSVAGYTHGSLFTKRAKNLLYHASGGVPLIVNMLSHKALLVAYQRGSQRIDYNAMSVAIQTTKDAKLIRKKTLQALALGFIALTTIFIATLYIGDNLLHR